MSILCPFINNNNWKLTLNQIKNLQVNTCKKFVSIKWSNKEFIRWPNDQINKEIQINTSTRKKISCSRTTK